MDGYAVRAADVAKLPATLAVIGQAAAGHPFSGSVGAGRPCASSPARRCPPAPTPSSSRRTRERDGDKVTVRGRHRHRPRPPPRLRLPRRRDACWPPAAASGPARSRWLPPWATARCPSAAARASPSSRPAMSSWLPGHGPAPARSSPPITWAWRRSPKPAGAEARLLGIARDTRESLDAYFAKAGDADIIVTIGGASVGDHDLVGPVLGPRHGAELLEDRHAAGQAADVRPPGPCARARPAGQSRVLAGMRAGVFLVPLIRALLGRRPTTRAPQARAGVALEANGPRQHYMRATSAPGSDGAGRRDARALPGQLAAGTSGRGRLPAGAPAAGPGRCRRRPRAHPAARFLSALPPHPLRRSQFVALQNITGTSMVFLICTICAAESPVHQSRGTPC